MITNDFKVLIVDDIGLNIQMVANLLKDENYQLSYAMSGEQALKLLSEKVYDLVLLDIMMPGLDGFETCKQLKELPNCREIPVIFLTARHDQESIVRSFECGGQDYVTKPFNPSELIARVRTHLKLRAFKAEQQKQIDKAVEDLQKANLELANSQQEVVFTVGAIAESRSEETGRHVKRVAEYSKLLAVLSGFPIHEADIVALASPMHDLGKVGIPDDILNKPGPLTDSEREIMDQHVILGYNMLKHSKHQIMQTAAIIALEHHEKWDGSGYPYQKTGEEIHIFGRITALADVFDAISSKRCYKESWSDEESFELIRAEKGKHFDPNLVDLFFDNIDQFMEIKVSFPDSPQSTMRAEN